ncbi:unnamed protein product [Lota lota]
MIHRAVLVLVLALGLETQLTCATEVSVNNSEGKLCLYANLMVNFSVTYEAIGEKNETTVFALPDTVGTNESSCDNTSSTLHLSFGKGHSWAMSFSKGAETYQADSITFAFNLADSSFFPNATSNETVTVNVTMKDLSKASIGTCYSCKSQDLIQEGGVSQTLWNVLIQAFVANGTKSKEGKYMVHNIHQHNDLTAYVRYMLMTFTFFHHTVTSCAADLPSTTTPAPTTQTSTVPTTTPSPSLPTPTTGKYEVTMGLNTTACLMATFGLRIGFKLEQKYQEINLEPNGTSASGTCGNTSSELVLSNPTTTIVFTFVNETAKFRLHAVSVNITSSSGHQFAEENNNLTLWVASVGSSYMCNKEQRYNITESLFFYTFDLQVQPFAIDGGKFSTAEECFLDSDLSFLVPIAVGVALSFLIILVLISYLIGRRKSRTGYQSV